MAMRPRGGAQVPRSQFIVRPTYDDFEPEFDQKEEPTAHILHVYLPGFTREQLKVTYDDSAKKIKARGERPLGNYRWSRFEKEFSIPDSCIGTQIKGKFERNVLMITMPKKVIIAPTPPKEPGAKKAMEEAASPSKPAPAEPKKTEQTIPPKPTSGLKPKEDKPAGPSSPKKATDSPQTPTSAADLGGEQADEKALSLPKVTSQTRPQKGHHQKPTSTADLGEEQRDANALSPPKAASQTIPQKGKQDSPQRPTSAADVGEKSRDTKAVETRPQEVQNQSRPHPKPTIKEERTAEKEKKDNRKEPETAAQDSYKKKMETSYGHPRTGEEERPEMSSAKKLIEAQDVAAYAKEVVGKLAKRLRDDDDSKQSLINAGVAAIVIVAMGAYIAYTIGSGDTRN